MTSLNSPDTAEGIGHHTDGLYTSPPTLADEPLAAREPELAIGEAVEEAIGGAWSESLRCSVRDNPLAAIAAAAIFGMVLARLTR